MNQKSLASIGGLALVGALALSACGSDSNTTSGSTAGSSSAAAASGGSSSAAASSGGSSAMTSSSGAGDGGPSGGITCAQGSLTLAGSTAQANAMATWIKAYQQACPGANINYGGGGSGAGVQQFTDGTIDFAGSDAPLDDTNTGAANKRCKSGPAIDLPMVPGPIALGYNLPGVRNLKLSAANIAKIFAGKITSWDDAAIVKDNPGVTLPKLPIQTFHRSDGSGTSFNFSAYLAGEAKADWSYGANKQWPAPGGQGSNGTAGIAQGVKTTKGALGYMELSYATQSGISTALVGNAGGKFVKLSTPNVVNFLSKAKITSSGNDLKLAFDYGDTSANAYPALLVTYEIACAKGNSSTKLPLIKGFLGYLASDTAQQQLPSLGYASLPKNIQAKVQKAIASMS